jgi:cysteine desulfurase
MKPPIYLDYNGTTPHDPEVIEAMRPFLEKQFGNPSSTHWYGVQTRDAVENAREQVAALLNCKPDEIIFTSGGTESNNFAIKGIAYLQEDTGGHIITTQIEHPAVIEVCGFLENQGFKVTYLPVDEYGVVHISDVEKAITPQTILITVMHANNEVGSIQPIKEISTIARKNKIIFHTDAAQSAGKILTDVNELGVDLLSIAGHKIYAPKGIGVLFVKEGIQLPKFIHGAGQEQDRRAGTENVLEIVGIGKACEIAQRDLNKNKTHMKKLRDRLFEGLKGRITDIRRNGHMEKCLPNTLSLSFKGLEANRIFDEIKNHVAVSTGAACHSNNIRISQVLRSMNVPVEWAKGTIRLTTGKMTTESEIENAIDILSDSVSKLRDIQA